MVDLFEEIANCEKRVLYTANKITHEDALRAKDPLELQRHIIEDRKGELTRAGFVGIEKVFEKFGLPVLPEAKLSDQSEARDQIRESLLWMSALRNLIEHNRWIVNREFFTQFPDSGLKVGDCIDITLSDICEAIGVVEWTADNLNDRAVEKFKIGSELKSP